MTKTPTNRVIDDYLRRLDRALRGVPRARRREVVEEIQAHIADARAEAGGLSEAEARTLLDRLGDPEDIAAEARGRLGRDLLRPNGFVIATVVLLLIGGFLLGIGWIVGVVMLWASDTWSARDKLIGTFLIPGGLAGTWLAMAFLLQGLILPGDSEGSGAGVDAYLSLAGFLLTLVIPFATAAWLLRRARRPAEDAPAFG